MYKVSGNVDLMHFFLRITSYQSFTKLRIQFSVEYAKRLTSKLVTCNIFMFVIVNFVGFEKCVLNTEVTMMSFLVASSMGRSEF